MKWCKANFWKVRDTCIHLKWGTEDQSSLQACPRPDNLGKKEHNWIELDLLPPLNAETHRPCLFQKEGPSVMTLCVSTTLSVSLSLPVSHHPLQLFRSSWCSPYTWSLLPPSCLCSLTSSYLGCPLSTLCSASALHLITSEFTSFMKPSLTSFDRIRMLFLVLSRGPYVL